MRSIGFFLMGKKGISVLKGIENEKPEFLDLISFVVGAKDTAVENDYYDEIEQFCKNNAIKFYDRNNVNHTDLRAVCAFVISWRWLIQDVPFDLIILHDSLLPKYRGFNPLVTALVEGDKMIGVSAISAEKEFDSGHIYGQEAINIEYPIKIKDAINKISQLYVSLSIELIYAIINDQLTSYPQDEAKVSYSLWRNEDDYIVDWSQDSNRIERFVDAVGFPYKGALTNYNNVAIRLINVSSTPDLRISNRKAGKILKIENNVPFVVCGRGMLKIDKAVTDDNGEEVKFNKLRVRLT